MTRPHTAKYGHVSRLLYRTHPHFKDSDWEWTSHYTLETGRRSQVAARTYSIEVSYPFYYIDVGVASSQSD
ncbi:hypothetical protein DPEC_G00089290 [Dallia pectoralis]|uniref:Uncharacterized protein n=1 Tax=Dallia pectoralis TaxID=75939 RepID=A0ACC2H0A9_DALPE|nr:hypothetical protein DPEC_G00089290 [Dallia pectoralis]